MLYQLPYYQLTHAQTPNQITHNLVSIEGLSTHDAVEPGRITYSQFQKVYLFCFPPFPPPQKKNCQYIVEMGKLLVAVLNSSCYCTSPNEKSSSVGGKQSLYLSFMYLG